MGRSHPEDDLQRVVAKYLDRMGWLWCHVPNGGSRRRIEAAILKGLGVKRGVPDILIFERWSSEKGTGHGVAIELKSARGRVREEQNDWLIALAARGWQSRVCRTLDEVIEVCELVDPCRRNAAS